MSSRQEQIKAKLKELNNDLKYNKNQVSRVLIIGEINSLNKELVELEKNKVKPVIKEEKKETMEINRGKVNEPNLNITHKEENKNNQQNNNNNKK